MKINREGNLVSDTHRQCTNPKCRVIFEKTSKTVTLCNKCNSEIVKSSDPRLKMLARAKSRAKKHNININIDISDIVIPEYCPILGVPLIIHKGSSGGKKNSASIDRIDSSKGYIKGNIMIISHLANMMKSSATNKELITFANWIKLNITG